MQEGSFEFGLNVHGRPVQEYHHEGQTWLEGRDGSVYELFFHNYTSARVEVVISVDGLSVMDGQEASTDKCGYLANPYQRIAIRGWRLNNQEVAKFQFGRLNESYASQMGKPRNIGVIGAAVFTEYQCPTLRTQEMAFRSGQNGTRGSQAKGIGTGFGESMEDRVTTKEFRRAWHNPSVLVLRYGTADQLRARGILVCGPHDRVAYANPFPADTGCTPPSGWRR